MPAVRGYALLTLHCRRALLGVLALVFLHPSAASAQGLFSVPTADTLERRTWSLDLEQDSGSRWNSPQTLRLTSLRAAVADFLTVGLDVRLTGATVIEPNASLRLTRKGAPLAFAVGYENVGVRSFGEQPYAVVSRQFPWGRAHVGWTHDDGGHHLMLGLEHPLCPLVSLQADAITDAGNFITLGAQINLPAHFTLTAGYMRANSRSDEDGVYLDLGHVTRF
jgi:hypothetical protein